MVVTRTDDPPEHFHHDAEGGSDVPGLETFVELVTAEQGMMKGLMDGETIAAWRNVLQV